MFEVQVNNKLFKKIKTKFRNWITINYEDIKTDKICFVCENEKILATIKNVIEWRFITGDKGLKIEFELVI